ncbi:MAG: hypothetical protein LBH32_02490 [Dysgonamonadaceae bacterium]|jgi:hypothetical protein|nr:hypothetical protein [Dysgonamonadaceae bacterium]
MKRKILKFAAIALIMAGTVARGEQEENKSQGNVPYKSCDCKKEQTGYIKTDAVLFKNLTEEQVNEKIYQSGFSGVMMVYNSIYGSIATVTYSSIILTTLNLK